MLMQYYGKWGQGAMGMNGLVHSMLLQWQCYDMYTI